MKNSISFHLRLAVLILISISLLPAGRVSAQNSPGKLKIGVYDSRAVVFAYSRSDFFREHQAKFARQSDSLNKAKDTAGIRQLSIYAISYQHLLHQMVFGTGSTAAITALVRDQLPEVARQAGVSVLVSKFELTYSDPSVEIVDLTNKVIQLFKPTENIDQMVGEITKTEPVPLEDLTIEEEMLTGFCMRFGK